MDINQEECVAGDYGVIHALYIDDRGVVPRENPSTTEDERYVCVLCQQHEMFTGYTEVVINDDYPGLVKLFGERVVEQAEETRIALNDPKTQGISSSATIVEDCEQVSYQGDVRGRIVVIRPEVLRRGYRHATYRFRLHTNGSDTHPNSCNTACCCTELHSGQKTWFEHSGILGVIAPEDLPKWTKHYLELQQTEKERNSHDREGRWYGQLCERRLSHHRLHSYRDRQVRARREYDGTVRVRDMDLSGK